MADPQDRKEKDTRGDEAPLGREAFYAQRRRRNLAIVWTIFGLAALFFVITILRMESGS